jgi:hypothetical protein
MVCLGQCPHYTLANQKTGFTWKGIAEHQRGYYDCCIGDQRRTGAYERPVVKEDVAR